MLIFDQLKKDDPQLRVVALLVLGGLGLLLAGLWWVQVVSARDYEASVATQSFRTVRIPAVRGMIRDRNGVALALNQPTCNINLYLDELREPFNKACSEQIGRRQAELQRQQQAAEKKLGRSLTRQERKQFALSAGERGFLREEARWQVVSNVVAQVSQSLRRPLALDRRQFERHYDTRLALPLCIAANLDPVSIARFEEQLISPLGVDLEVQSARIYPFQTLAAHLLGYLHRDDSSVEGEDAFFSYRLPDFRGLVGVEAGFDKQLRGTAGSMSVMVNSVGYRQTANVWAPVVPGHNLVLTIDKGLQEAAERALQTAPLAPTPVRGAVVVMDVRSGDILALASSPAFNPNAFIPRISSPEWQRITELQAEKNRATQENYMPGSIFKTIVGLAALEAGWNPGTEIAVEPDPRGHSPSALKVDGHWFSDTVQPGKYRFKLALEKSSNSYFIRAGLFAGPTRIIRLAQRVHFGERTGLPTRQEVSGSFPREVTPGWSDIGTGNLSIGQETVWVTPLQIAVLMSALANGGDVLWPRLVDRIEPQDLTLGEPPEMLPRRPPRDRLGVSARSLAILHDAMLSETEEPEGTGRPAAQAAPGMRICGKTGTAQVQDVNSHKTGQTTWFASFAPFEAPRYAVVVMVEDGSAGGKTCAPVAGKIYAAIQAQEQTAGTGAVASAK
jgi:penicillin-binding protein 2